MTQHKNNMIFSWTALALSFVGFLDSLYLTIEHYRGGDVICVVLGGCEKVLTSAYASVFGMFPTSLLGVGYYGAIFLALIAYIQFQDTRILIAVAGVTVIGFFVSLWFIYVQLFVLGAMCAYCMLSAAVSTLLFASGMIFLIKGRSD